MFKLTKNGKHNYFVHVGKVHLRVLEFLNQELQQKSVFYQHFEIAAWNVKNILDVKLTGNKDDFIKIAFISVTYL